jgi:uncharacterized alpha-E superfamily protein
MLSRIADSLYWIARYLERAQETARILDVNYYMVLEHSQAAQRLRWQPLIDIAGDPEDFQRVHPEANSQTVFEYLAFREENPNSIAACIGRARENARTIRERISREMWEDINSLYHTIHRFKPSEEIAAGPHRFCNLVKFATHRFRGVADGTLPHDEGWQFLRIGSGLERAEMTARIVDVQYRDLVEAPREFRSYDNHQWLAVLKSVGAYEAYRRTYLSRVEPERVAELLILHADHPRSVRFNIQETQAGLRAISGTMPGHYANEAERLTGRLLESLRYHRIEEIFERGFHQYLEETQQTCRAIGTEIARTYFYYAVTP